MNSLISKRFTCFKSTHLIIYKALSASQSVMQRCRVGDVLQHRKDNIKEKILHTKFTLLTKLTY